MRLHRVHFRNSSSSRRRAPILIGKQSMDRHSFAGLEIDKIHFMFGASATAITRQLSRAMGNKLYWRELVAMRGEIMPRFKRRLDKRPMGLTNCLRIFVFAPLEILIYQYSSNFTIVTHRKYISISGLPLENKVSV